MRIFKNIFFKVLLMFILSSVTFGAENRIDLDLRLEPKNEKNFYLLKENFINKDVISIDANAYKIVRSRNELFVDEYYDTVLQSLFKKKASLRYRKRFIDSVNSKNLIQFKTQKGNSELIGMNEFKIEINLDETIVSYRDFKNYINRAKKYVKKDIHLGPLYRLSLEGVVAKKNVPSDVMATSKWCFLWPSTGRWCSQKKRQKSYMKKT